MLLVIVIVVLAMVASLATDAFDVKEKKEKDGKRGKNDVQQESGIKNSKVGSKNKVKHGKSQQKKTAVHA